jgi:hypothetical protein
MEESPRRRGSVVCHDQDVEVMLVYAPRAARTAPAVAAFAVAAALVGGLMLGVLLIAFASAVS